MAAFEHRDVLEFSSSPIRVGLAPQRRGDRERAERRRPASTIREKVGQAGESKGR